MENKGDDLWMDMYASAKICRGLSSASVLENQGSGNFSSHDGSLPSCSSSERDCSIDLIHKAAKVIDILEDGEVRAMLQDAKVRAVLRKVTINEGVLNKAIQSLGGGEKGLKSLMGYILVWVKQQRDIQSSSPQPPPPPSPPAWDFSIAEDVVLQPSSDAFQILSGSLQPPPTTQLLDQDVHRFQRSTSRKLMTRESEMGAGLGGVDTGLCPSSFISSPEDCQPEGTRPDTTAPCIPQHHISKPSVEPTPAMATKAARKHRMTRQRESFHGRAASRVAITGGSFWNTNAASAPAVTSSGISGAHATPPRAPVTATGEGRSMECLTELLQKELRPSDVSHLGRIILPKKEAEHRMPSLTTRGSVSLQMEDFDSGHVWNLKYSRFWSNNKSRMYLLENTAAFVISHGLVEGDVLVIYRVLQGGYVLRGMKKENGSANIEPVKVEFAHSSAKSSGEGQPSLHENGTLVQRLSGCCPSDKSVKEEPVNLDDDPFLDDLILSIVPSLESDSSSIQSLKRFPTLSLDFPLEEIMAEARTEPEGT